MSRLKQGDYCFIEAHYQAGYESITKNGEQRIQLNAAGDGQSQPLKQQVKWEVKDTTDRYDAVDPAAIGYRQD